MGKSALCWGEVVRQRQTPPSPMGATHQPEPREMCTERGEMLKVQRAERCSPPSSPHVCSAQSRRCRPARENPTFPDLLEVGTVPQACSTSSQRRKRLVNEGIPMRKVLALVSAALLVTGFQVVGPLAVQSASAAAAVSISGPVASSREPQSSSFTSGLGRNTVAPR